jgi:cholesterol oxidase
MNSFDYDFIIIGSGFGGSVAALRLVEKGYKVCVVEQGKKLTDAQLAAVGEWKPKKNKWGARSVSYFRHFIATTGIGVGGGSLVYACKLSQPSAVLFNSVPWKVLENAHQQLQAYFQLAKKMLGAAVNPRLTDADHILQGCAEALGKGDTFSTAEVGVYFGEPGEAHPDPYFDGQGPQRVGCVFCGNCNHGCAYQAKNYLQKNYLYLAEKKDSLS